MEGEQRYFLGAAFLAALGTRGFQRCERSADAFLAGSAVLQRD